MKWLGVISLAALILPSVALADPCEGALPHRGEAFGGPVRYVGDGDSLCVGRSRDPKAWIEVRLENFYAPELHAPGGAAAKQALQRVTRGKLLQCVAGKRSYDRVVAQCTADGVPVADLLRRAGVVEGGRGRGQGSR